jgi:heptosyltransferase I
MTAPSSICLLRTSAIGDVTHVVPLVRTLQQALPETALTWIVGKLERRLVGDLPGVRFVTFDKGAGRAGIRAVHAELKGERFDALLQMQVALRSNLLSLGIRAERRIGYDRARSKDLHSLVVNERIPARTGEHVLDAIGSFCEPLGLKQTQVRWDIPISDADREWAQQQLPGERPTLLVSPASSHALRNWRAERYAARADHAAQRHGLRVLLCGGRSPLELEYGERIASRMREPCVNLVGKDTLLELLATLQRATVLVSPDSGPAHMATTVGTPVIGLYAATNPERSGPYHSRAWCVNRYERAARVFLGKSPADLPWTTKIERPGVMDLVEVADATERLDALMAAGAPRTPTRGPAPG